MKNAIFTLNNPNAPRLCPELAEEIGLNESIILLQIEFWIRTSTTEEHEGRRWTYQSITDMQTFFPFWSPATINRAIQSLIEKNLLIIGNFNRARYDKTRWFTLNHAECAKLNSIRVGGHDTRSNQNDTGSTQNETRSTQDETTIPESTAQTTTNNIGDSKTESPTHPAEEKEIEYPTAEESYIEFQDPLPRESHSRETIAASAGAYQPGREGIADPHVSKKKYSRVVSGMIARALSPNRGGTVETTPFDETVAGQFYEKGYPTDKVRAYCEFIAEHPLVANDGKEPNAKWVLNGFGDWKAKGYQSFPAEIVMTRNDDGSMNV